MIFSYKDIKSFLKISEEINSLEFLSNSNPDIKRMYKDIQINSHKLNLDYPFNIIFEYISFHFANFDLYIEKKNLTERLEKVSSY